MRNESIVVGQQPSPKYSCISSMVLCKQCTRLFLYLLS